MPDSPIAYAGFALMLAAVAFALWRGGRPERLGALAIGFGWILTGLAQGDDWDRVPWGSFAVDCGVAAALVAIAVRSDRGWATFASAFQLLNLASYLVYALDHALLGRSFVTLTYLWSCGVLGSLAAGVAHQRREQRGDGAAGSGSR